MTDRRLRWSWRAAARGRSTRVWAVLGLLAVGTAVLVVRPWSSPSESREVMVKVPAGPRIYTLVGNGRFTADGGRLSPQVGKRATEVEAPFGADVALASNGDVLVADLSNVWRIGPDGILRVAAGNGRTRNSREPDNGDGGPATRAFVEPSAIAALPDGGFLIAEQYEGRVRRVSADGTITTVAGTIPPGWEESPSLRGRRGDGGPAIKAHLEPVAVAVTGDGGFLVLEPSRVRRVAPGGRITTVAGTGVGGFSGDGGPAVRARIHAFGGSECVDDCGDIAATSDGGFLIAETVNRRIRKVSGDGRITTVAGNGRAGPPTDGVPAVQSPIYPVAVAAAPAGGFRFFEDVREDALPTIREVGSDGTVTTVVGRGGFTPEAAAAPVGDGAAARDALLDPTGRGLVSTPEGGWIFTDFARIRLVTPALPQRLDAAVNGVDGWPGSPAVRVSSTAGGMARVTLTTAAGQVAASATQPVVAGDATIGLSAVQPGAYWLDLKVSGSGDRFTSSRLAVVLGTTLAEPLARLIARRISRNVVGLRVGECHRVNPRRIDCEARRNGRCDSILEVRLRHAFTFVGRHRCRGGVLRLPGWLRPAEPWPALGEALR